MKKLIVLLISVALCAILLLGCSGANQLVVSLSGNPTTGYTWDYVINEPTILKEVSNEYKVDDEKLTGSGGVFEFVFEGQAPGEADLTFSYQRPWEEEAPVATVVYRVGVNSDGSIASCEEVSSTGDAESSAVF